MRSQDFSLGGVAFGRWAVKIQTCRGVRGHHVLPRENLRNFGLPGTTFRAFL